MTGTTKKDLNVECWLIIRNSKKVIKDNFLNLLCALSCVVFSADCSAIVFLRVNFKVAFYLISNFKLSVPSWMLANVYWVLDRVFGVEAADLLNFYNDSLDSLENF